MSRAHTAPAVPLRKVLVPAEHGAWGFLAEPILLGLLIAFSWPGLALAAAVVAAFLARHPMKLALGDRRRGKRYPRTEAAERAVLLLGPLTVTSLVAAVAGGGARGLLPFLFAAPFALLALAQDLQNRARTWPAELAGPVALGAAAPAIAMAHGWALLPALGLWGVVIARAVPSVLYVRARLRLERGEPVPRGVSEAAQGTAVLGTAWLAGGGFVPWLAVVAIGILAGRAFVGLSSLRKPAAARRIGFTELGLGVLSVLLVATGYWGGW